MAGPRPLVSGFVFTGDLSTQDMQRSARDIAGALNSIPFLSGRAISVRLVGGAATTINHQLGVPAAFIVIRHNYDGTGNATAIVESATAYQTGLDAKSQLSIVASVSCLADLWFYPRASVLIPTGKAQAP